MPMALRLKVQNLVPSEQDKCLLPAWDWGVGNAGGVTIQNRRFQTAGFGPTYQGLKAPSF